MMGGRPHDIRRQKHQREICDSPLSSELLSLVLSTDNITVILSSKLVSKLDKRRYLKNSTKNSRPNSLQLFGLACSNNTTYSILYIISHN